jgi:hypothetical protein
MKAQGTDGSPKSCQSGRRRMKTERSSEEVEAVFQVEVCK